MSDEQDQPQLPEPDHRQKLAIQKAAVRYEKRPEPLSYGSQAGMTNKMNGKGKHSDDAGHILQVVDAFGTASPEFAQHNAGRVAAVMRQRGAAIPDETELNAGLAAVSGIAPENEAEAMLAVQMVGTHEVAMEMLTKAKRAETTDQLERYGSLATKLLRTYTTQLEALAKLRRGGSQKVTVEHVHVYEGGQAIVGNVPTQGAQPRQGGGGRQETGHQPHALTGPAALAFQADPEMLCSNTDRDAVSIASGEGKGAVPDARRIRRKRSAKG
ncbi:hypothetical protein [Methylobacterium sp. J-077]|uniref:hypothetical protein n=1 Tax=Methylobacterium sp. J-077 TaxID=2836656 RepID=UPI001FBB4697|nr:hypothetical protein [Methylobacterium sp. J-077]MCJ2126429.1 hypothetical protein [Methylobacterium sp. J-077]